MKLAKKAEATIKQDPRVLERPIWGRLRLLVEDEACHSDWGCALYRLHRTGRIDNDQREAGDRYAILIRDHRKLWRDPVGMIEVYRAPYHESLEKRSHLTHDVERLMGMVEGDKEESEFETKRAKKIGARYREARAVAGRINTILEDLLVDEIWPTGERQHKEISHALTRLSHFFSTGNKARTRKV